MEKLYMCGRNSVIEAIQNNYPIECCFVSNENALQEIKKINNNIKVIVQDKLELNKKTSQNHQGYIALIKEINFYDFEILKKDLPNKVLVLDHLYDPHNFGAILRTANAFGIKHIIYPKDRSVDINSTVLKISSGGFIGIKFIKVNSISATITKLKNMNFWTYGTVLNSKASSVSKTNFNFPLALVVGNEEKGTSKSTLSLVDSFIYIPQEGTVQSLNVSVATGILLYEISKQQK
ncbi:MAG: 23S rRNA (guanosine(2251)-2'-O)-methyltransferase RlmB [Metamycoplasmataceae bacterium]